MPTLIIDNYDSFTYNLVHMVADPLVIRNDEMTWDEISRLSFDRVIISPGPGRPIAPWDFGVCSDVILNARVPVLGVCLGHQGIAQAFGGAVVQGTSVHGYQCEVRHDGDSLFNGIPQGFKAVRYHSLNVQEPLPGVLKPIAWAEDGTLMALRHRERPIWGVQFHPESILTEHGQTLINNFTGDNLDVVTGLAACNSSAERGFRQPPNICITYEGETISIPAEACELPPPTGRLFTAPRNVRYAISREDYVYYINQCKRWIRRGESYEMCLTNKLLLETDILPSDYYHRLAKTPYSTFIDLGHTQIACASPECFLRIDTDGNIQSRPIKGTLPGARDPDELRTNLRFRAENLMIVDLVRNDLSKVCIPGSVHVPALMEVETYPTLHQLVSTIEGKLRPGIGAMDAISAAFPGGSMTGAPKKRTMNLLRLLEPEPRGIYSGTIGYINPDGSAEFNIVIRTAVFQGNQVSIGVGGAIIADSDPEEEWAEMELKAQALLQAFMPDAQQA